MKKMLTLMLLCLLLAGCSHSDTAKTETEISVDFDFTCRQSYTDAGTVYLDAGILHFTDAESGLDTVICPKADCKHEGESLHNPDPTCSGWVEGINTCCPMIVNDKLYFIYTPDFSDSGYGGFMEKRLCRADKDGTHRRDIAELHCAETITAASYDNGKLAVAYRTTFDDRGENLEKSRCFVTVIDLESGETVTSSVIEEYQGIINKLWLDDGKAYYCSSYTTENIDFDKWDVASSEFQQYLNGICKADIMYLDIDTNKAETVYSSASCADMGWGYALVTDSSPKLVSFADGSVRELEGIDADCAFTLCSEGVLIYDTSAKEYSLYAFADEKVTNIYNADKKVFLITAVTDKLIYVSYGNDESYGTGIIDMADFLDGNGVEIRRLSGEEF